MFHACAQVFAVRSRGLLRWLRDPAVQPGIRVRITFVRPCSRLSKCWRSRRPLPKKQDRLLLPSGCLAKNPSCCEPPFARRGQCPHPSCRGRSLFMSLVSTTARTSRRPTGIDACDGCAPAGRRKTLSASANTRTGSKMSAVSKCIVTTALARYWKAWGLSENGGQSDLSGFRRRQTDQLAISGKGAKLGKLRHGMH